MRTIPTLIERPALPYLVRIRMVLALAFSIGAAPFFYVLAAAEPQPVQIEGVHPVYRAGQKIPFTLSNTSGHVVSYAAGVEYRERNKWFGLVVNVEEEIPSGMQTFSQLDPKSARKLSWAPPKMPDYFAKGDYRIFVDVRNVQGRPTRYCSRSFRIEATAKVLSSGAQVPIEASSVKGAWVESDAKWTRVRTSCRFNSGHKFQFCTSTKTTSLDSLTALLIDSLKA